MSYSNLPNQGSAQIFQLEEATLDTFNATGTYEEMAIGTCTFAVQEQQSILQENNRPVPTDIVHHSAHITGQFDLPMRFGRDCSDFLAYAMRDTVLPAEANVTTAAECSFLSAETHLDGVTGQQIVDIGTTGAFDTLLTASSQSDLRQALLVITDAATAGNNSATRGPVLVKTGNPRTVGADTKMDLDIRMFQTGDAGPSTTWGGDWAANDTLDAINLDAGAYLGLRLARPSGNDTISCVVKIGDIATPQFWYLTGVAMGGPTLAWNGRGHLSWQIPYIASGWSNLSVTDPAAGGTLQDTVNTYKTPMAGQSRLTKIFLATDSATLALEGTEVVFNSWGAPSSPTMVHDTHGINGPSGYFHTRYAPEFSFAYQLANAAAPRAVTLQTWANAHTPVTAILQFTDPAGNVIYLKADEAIPASTIAPSIGGADGVMRGTFSAIIKEKTRDDLAWTYHQFAA